MLLDKVKIEKRLTVREIRALTMLSQKEFAEEIHMPYSSYAKKEQGNVRFFPNEISAISFASKVPLENIEF